MKAEEEKTISVTFPEDYPAENLKGKPAEFKIKLHEIKKRVLPELNEEFVKELGIEGVETVEAYLAYVKEQLAKAKQEESERKFEYDLLKKICDDATMNVPQVLIDRRIDSYIEAEEERAQGHNMKFEQLLAYQGMNLDQYREYVAGTAAFEVRKELVLNEIIKAENIALDEADYEKGYRDIADAYRMTPEEVKERFPQENVTHYFLLNKTVDLLKEKAIVQAQK
jgi:trigger factor